MLALAALEALPALVPVAVLLIRRYSASSKTLKLATSCKSATTPFSSSSRPLARAQWRRFGQRAAHTRTLARRHLCGPDCGLGHTMPVDHRRAWKPLLTATPWASAHPDIVVVHTSVASNSLASGKPPEVRVIQRGGISRVGRRREHPGQQRRRPRIPMHVLTIVRHPEPNLDGRHHDLV